jgi:hypothetical protein
MSAEPAYPMAEEQKNVSLKIKFFGVLDRSTCSHYI